MTDLHETPAPPPGGARLLPLRAGPVVEAAVARPSPPLDEAGGERRAARRALLTRRIRWFVGLTITYNVVEAVIALSAGAAASSGALIGFGLDSVIEVSSAAAVAWQFSA